MAKTRPKVSIPAECLITVATAAGKLEITECHVRRLIREKTLNAIKFGHVWMVDERSLPRFEPRRNPTTGERSAYTRH